MCAHGLDSRLRIQVQLLKLPKGTLMRPHSTQKHVLRDIHGVRNRAHVFRVTKKGENNTGLTLRLSDLRARAW